MCGARISKLSALLLLALTIFLLEQQDELALSVMAQPYRGYYDEKCTDAETGRELYVGEAFTRPVKCIRVQCLGTLQLWEESCHVPKLKGNCNQLPSLNNFDDYPRCCPFYECRVNATDVNRQTDETRTYDHFGRLRKTVINQIFVVHDLQDGRIPGSGLKTQFEI